jgi:hypothetical protein
MQTGDGRIARRLKGRPTMIDESTGIELKPCPFCKADYASTVVFPDTDRSFSQVVCPICDTLGPMRETREESANAWNERPAAIEWRTDEPPKDGTPILAVFFKYDNCTVVTWSDARGFWFIGDDRIETNPDYWAHINHPEGKEWV